MSEEGNVTSSLKFDEDVQPSAGILSQYVKDLSVESPNAPESFQWTDQPQMDIQFNIAARAIQPTVHEAELKITLAAKHEAGTAYIVDLTFAGLIAMQGLDENQMHAFIFAEAPRLLFPFARRVLADAVRDAGFGPMLLEPIDFGALYFQQMQAQAEGQGETPDIATAEPAGHA
jgi:preprotein translocase subunit SecB